jgi:hypothetical protein
MVIWYIFPRFGMLYQKNLATLNCQYTAHHGCQKFDESLFEKLALLINFFQTVLRSSNRSAIYFDIIWHHIFFVVLSL